MIIAFTKPFKFGDYIIVKAKDGAGIEGTVNMIGLQSSQLQLDGAIAHVPNKLLTSSVVVRKVGPETEVKPETEDEQEAA